MKYPKSIGIEVKSLSNLIKRQLDNNAAQCGLHNLTGTQGFIIGYLRHHEDQDIYQRDLESYFHIRRATATKTLKLMEQNGLLTRQAVKNDGRLKKLALTPLACEGHDKIMELIDKSEDKMRENISEEELKIFFQVMEQIKTNME